MSLGLACALCMLVHIQSVDDSRNVTQYCQQDVDEEVGVATPLKEDTQRWEEDGKNDLANVAIYRYVLARLLTYNKPRIK